MKKRTVDIQMFYGASPKIMERAADLRSKMTEAERNLWEFLKKNKVTGLHFRRQHPIASFIADFYCHAIKLVIEVDGGYHQKRDQREYDTGRQAEFENLGIRVIRYTNEQIENNFRNIKQEIIRTCVERKKELRV